MKNIITDLTLLRIRSLPVETIDAHIADLVDEMKAVVLAHRVSDGAVGLAACQLGEHLAIFVILTPALELVAINPQVSKLRGEQEVSESCLSLPGMQVVVTRPKLLKFRYQDLTGDWHAVKFHDLYAVIAAHEIDHLAGRLITDE